MRTYLASAIVLRRIDLGEKDRILTLFSREHGKLSAVAKGARRPGSRLAGTSEPFTYSKMLLSSGRDLDVLSQAEIKESFPNVKASIAGVAYGVYLLELVNSSVDQRQPNPDIFDTLLSAMYVLEGGTDPEMTARYFEVQLLSILGYEPHFEACLRCGRTPASIRPPDRVYSAPAEKERVSFSPAMGGIICAKCGSPPNDAISVPAAISSYVKALRAVEPHKIKDMHFPKGARRDLARMLRWHIRYRLERDLKSTDFIDMISEDGG